MAFCYDNNSSLCCCVCHKQTPLLPLSHMNLHAASACVKAGPRLICVLAFDTLLCMCASKGCLKCVWFHHSLCILASYTFGTPLVLFVLLLLWLIATFVILEIGSKETAFVWFGSSLCWFCNRIWWRVEGCRHDLICHKYVDHHNCESMILVSQVYESEVGRSLWWRF